MTPLENSEHKMRWKPGYCVRLHSDLVTDGKQWCRRNLQRQEWSVTTYTNVYEHTFHFEEIENGKLFETIPEFKKFINQ